MHTPTPWTSTDWKLQLRESMLISPPLSPTTPLDAMPTKELFLNGCGPVQTAFPFGNFAESYKNFKGFNNVETEQGVEGQQTMKVSSNDSNQNQNIEVLTKSLQMPKLSPLTNQSNCAKNDVIILILKK